MGDIVNNNQDALIIIYCIFILWINIGYLRDYKNIKEGLANISSEDELDIRPDSFSVLLIGLLFNFVRRWLIYLLAIFITGNEIVVIISSVLFGVSLYDTFYNYKLEKIKSSNIGKYLAIIDTLFIIIFVIYLFIFM